MNTPVSVPVVPAQPNQQIYAIQELALFKTYTRDTYRAAFGVEAPSWDPTRLRKSWFDTSAADPVSYKTAAVDQTGAWSMTPYTMTAAEASSVNLPGAIVYPAYVVAPSAATRAGSGINAMYLSLEADARALMAIVGGDSLLDEGMTTVFPVQYPPDEPRRLWDIVFKGTPVNVGALLFSRNAKGVGSPGTWDSSGNEPVWVPAPPAPTGLDDTRPDRPVPLRDLLPNEKFQVGLMGVTIGRTDLISDGQFTADDRATLRSIYRLVSGT